LHTLAGSQWEEILELVVLHQRYQSQAEPASRRQLFFQSATAVFSVGQLCQLQPGEIAPKNGG
jgi:hypothetical protein